MAEFQCIAVFPDKQVLRRSPRLGCTKRTLVVRSAWVRRERCANSQQPRMLPLKRSAAVRRRIHRLARSLDDSLIQRFLPSVLTKHNSVTSTHLPPPPGLPSADGRARWIPVMSRLVFVPALAKRGRRRSRNMEPSIGSAMTSPTNAKRSATTVRWRRAIGLAHATALPVRTETTRFA